MSTVGSLLRNVDLPPLVQVRRSSVDDSIGDARGAVWSTLEQSGIAVRLRPGMRVALGIGSRGLSHLPELVAATVAWFAGKGTQPFIVPSMGSHGGASAEGQTQVLAQLGITEQSVGCPIRSSMEVTHLGDIEPGLPVYMDAHAAVADGIFVINRVKPHTALSGPHESGLVKMIAIGLGKQKGAAACHALGYGQFPAIMPRMASFALAARPGFLGALAVVENARKAPCLIEAVPSGRLVARDRELLVYARKRMPALPLQEFDVLVVDRIGKNISGSGMDPNITGRYSSPYKSGGPAITRIAVLDLTEETQGHATGMGNADAITRRLFEKVNFDYVYANAITSTLFRGASTPVVLRTDKEVLSCMVKTCNAGEHPVRLIRIRDTATLDRFLVSPAVADLLQKNSDCRILSEPKPMKFTVGGALQDRDIWENFPG